MTQSQQEALTLAVVGAFAVFIFWETREFAAVQNGQFSPGAFPRLAAGAMAALAVLRMILLVVRVANEPPPKPAQWAWESVRRPLGATVLMAAYAAAFGSVPFAPLTVVFIFSAFILFGVRPLSRLIAGTALASTFLYVLFVPLLDVGVN